MGKPYVVQMINPILGTWKDWERFETLEAAIRYIMNTSVSKGVRIVKEVATVQHIPVMKIAEAEQCPQ